MSKFVYKSRFSLPIAEADYLCALAKIVGMDPDECLRRIVRLFAKNHPEIHMMVWDQAMQDGKGPWPSGG